MLSHLRIRFGRIRHASVARRLSSSTAAACLVALVGLTALPQAATAQPATPRNAPTSFTLAQPRRLIPEETFVVAREAAITQAGETGAWIVTFKNKPGEGTLPPMFLMPSRRLQRLETALSNIAKNASAPSAQPLAMPNAIVSGQIFAYRKYNFLMLTAMPRLQPPTPVKTNDSATTSQDPSTDNQGTGAAANPASTDAETKADDDPDSNRKTSASADVEAMIKELESGGPVAPILQRPSADPANRTATNNRTNDTQSNSDRKPLLEGAFVMNRAARLIRSNDTGAWAIVFDSDDTGLEDAPLIVLPCKMLESMEARAKQLGDSFRLNVSGQVYTYQSGIYLLPTLMQIPYQRDNLSPS